jgi:hypothetical protein
MIKYKRSKDGSKIKTNGIAFQVSKTMGIAAADFRTDMAERWQQLTVKTAVTLVCKTFIPFRKEGDMGGDVMITSIQKQNNFLRSTKQRTFVQNLNGIDCIIYIATYSAEDMDAATIILCKIFYKYKDDDGGQLFDAIKKTNTGRIYILIFHERNTETFDRMLSNMDASLDAFGTWDYCDVHFRYMAALPISGPRCKVYSNCFMDKSP